VVIEAGVIAGYLIAWAMRKARRVGGRLDDETDNAIDAGMDMLHEAVAAKLTGHPVLAELDEEAAEGSVSDLTRQQVELAVAAAARRDEEWARRVTELTGRLRQAEVASAGQLTAGPGSAVFTGDAHVRAEGGGIAIGQVAGDVHVAGDRAGPQPPGRTDR
jgi:hypothetical protein